MALAETLVQKGGKSEYSLLRRHPCEDVFGVQIAGCNAHALGKLSEIINNEFEVDFVDINMGCPLDPVCNKGCGAGLMRRPNRIKECVERMTQILKVRLLCSVNVIVYKIILYSIILLVTVENNY